MISWWDIEFGENELNKIISSFKNKNLSQGIVTKEFEELICQYLNVKYTIAVSSGSSALLLALMSLDIGTDDEVIIPNRTWIATAHAIHLLGAKVIPVDVQEDKPIIDIYKLKKAITLKTKVIILMK